MFESKLIYRFVNPE